jgi:hypothetical protein
MLVVGVGDESPARKSLAGKLPHARPAIEAGLHLGRDRISELWTETGEVEPFVTLDACGEARL